LRQKTLAFDPHVRHPSDQMECGGGKVTDRRRPARFPTVTHSVPSSRCNCGSPEPTGTRRDSDDDDPDLRLDLERRVGVVRLCQRFQSRQDERAAGVRFFASIGARVETKQEETHKKTTGEVG
jgi:hypothetical protein